jgi:hypothetical protein
MQQDDITLTGISANQHALHSLHQLVKFQVKAKLATTKVGTAKAESAPQVQRTTRRRGRAFSGSNSVNVEWPANVLGLMFTAIDVGIVSPQLGHVAYRARDSNPTWFSQHLDSFSEINSVAENIVTFLVHDDFAEMNADAEHKPLLISQPAVEMRHALLDVDCRADGRDRRTELGEHGVAHAVNQRTASTFNGRLPNLGTRHPKILEGEVFLTFYQTHKAGKISVQNCRQSPFRTCHGY